MAKSFLLTLFFLLSCSHVNNHNTFSGNIFGTFYQIKYENNNSSIDNLKIEALINRIFDKIDNSMSLYKKDSEINKINNLDIIKNYQISDDLYYVLSKALNYCKSTGNAFNPTIDSVIELWGFGVNLGNKNVPDSLSIVEFLEHARCNKIRLNKENQSLTKLDKDINLNLNAIAKGYTVDLIHEMFKKNKIDNYMINIGGEIRTSGVNFNNKKWKIDIAYPDTLNNYNQSILSLGLSNHSIATSGNYNNYFIENEKMYSHIFKPDTGYPISNNVISATIISKNCIDADALATASMVLGTSALNLVNYNDSIGVCLIMYDYNSNTPRIHFNEYFEEFIILD